MSDHILKDESGRELTWEEVAQNVGPGWHQLLKDLINRLWELGWDGTLRQVKEKYGGLQLYIGLGNTHIWDEIIIAETQSLSICEFCGAEGTPREGGWIKTLCMSCYELWETDREKLYARSGVK